MVANCSHEKCPKIKKDSVLIKGQVAGLMEISVGLGRWLNAKILLIYDTNEIIHIQPTYLHG